MHLLSSRLDYPPQRRDLHLVAIFKEMKTLFIKLIH